MGTPSFGSGTRPVSFLHEPLWWLGFIGSFMVCRWCILRQVRRARYPRRPTGVRIEREDGTTLNVELIYLGRDPAGTDHWQIAGAVLGEGDVLAVGYLPARCEITGAMQP